MRDASVLALTLALCVAACGKAEAPAATETSAPTASPATAAVNASGAPPPAAEPALPSATPAPPAPIAPSAMNALGTEPFWNARIDGSTLVYTTPEDQKGRSIAVERRDTAIGAVFSGKLGDAPLILTLAKRTCSDGMSDREYPFSAVLTIGSQRRTGCAS